MRRKRPPKQETTLFIWVKDRFVLLSTTAPRERPDLALVAVIIAIVALAMLYIAWKTGA